MDYTFIKNVRDIGIAIAGREEKLTYEDAREKFDEFTSSYPLLVWDFADLYADLKRLIVFGGSVTDHGEGKITADFYWGSIMFKKWNFR